MLIYPSDESLGYCQMSLRDKIENCPDIRSHSQTSSPSRMHPVSTNQLPQLYAKLLSERETEATIIADDTRAFHIALRSLDELHFLDWQACRLLTIAGIRCVLHVAERAPSHVRSRIAARIVFDNFDDNFKLNISNFKLNISDLKSSVNRDSELSKDDERIAYQPGALLDRFLTMRGWSKIWHDYLTSRDAHFPRVHAGRTLANQYPHVRTGFITGIDLFHQGSFYQAHEDWESLWMRLDAHDAHQRIERHAAQGLIQLSGAHLHRLKGRHAPAVKLFRAAANHLARAVNLEWLDAPALLAASTRIFDNCRSPEAALEPIVIPFIPLKYADIAIARKHR